MQFLHVLETPVKSWTTLMKQLAGDGVYRIFQALAEQVEIPASRILDRNTLIKCLLSGKSESKWLKEVKKIKTGLGHEVKTLQNGEEKVFLLVRFMKSLAVCGIMKLECIFQKNQFPSHKSIPFDTVLTLRHPTAPSLLT